MSIHVVTKSTRYRVGDGPVSVRVVIGDAQAGGWAVGWDDQHVLGKGSAPETVTVGRGKDIVGRTLQVNATAIDVRPETNRLSSTLTISGGPDGDQQIVSTYNEGGDGDAAVFATMIGFE